MIDDNLSREIWDEFRSLSDQDGIKAFGLYFGEKIGITNHPNSGQFLKENIDTKIDRLLSQPNPDFNELVKLYDIHNDQIDPVLFDWRDKQKILHKKFYNDVIALDFLLEKRWGTEIKCPHCHEPDPYVTLRGYKCRSRLCYKKFTHLSGTVFENTKLPLVKWYSMIYLITSNRTRNISTHKLAKAVEISQKIAWYNAKKIKALAGNKIIGKINNDLFTFRPNHPLTFLHAR